MLVLVVIASAVLHALWNAILRREPNKDIAGVAMLSICGAATVVASGITCAMTARAPFEDIQSALWSVGAGVFEAGYFLTLVKALERAPLGVAYTVSRGVAIAVVWPVSALWLHETLTTPGLVGSGLLVIGLLTTTPIAGTRGLGSAGLCGLFIAGYHLCDKWAMATGTQAAAVSGVSLSVSVLINVARLRAGRWSALSSAVRARPAPIVGAGIISAASFLIFLFALAAGGVGFVLTLRNTSIVFALLLGFAIGDKPTRRQMLGAVMVTGGAIVLGIAR